MIINQDILDILEEEGYEIKDVSSEIQSDFEDDMEQIIEEYIEEHKKQLAFEYAGRLNLKKKRKGKVKYRLNFELIYGKPKKKNG